MRLPPCLKDSLGLTQISFTFYHTYRYKMLLLISLLCLLHGSCAMILPTDPTVDSDRSGHVQLHTLPPELMILLEHLELRTFVPRSVVDYNTIFALVVKTGNLPLIKLCLARPDFKEHLTQESLTQAWMDSRHDLNLFDVFLQSRLSVPIQIRLFKYSVRQDKNLKAVERFFIQWQETGMRHGSQEELCVQELFGNPKNYMDFSRRDFKTLQVFAAWHKIPLIERLIESVFKENPAPVLSRLSYRPTHVEGDRMSSALTAAEEIAHQVAHLALRP